ncbi:MAG: hypothetical protein HKP48_08335 [Winogradskyella sp.]|uniref:Ig-like domain-containing protein n=1 Tax=Winogradskyella sp. TaxID=1883156 RepID=UPI0018223212|nr:Ig-like domain-containing protein [Winogradskyella sp.]MBT8243686.1 hypothetical protein [Winogradskyella sp.]NNK23282.1 hypothetical protein [Winogradskyella sp.]
MILHKDKQTLPLTNFSLGNDLNYLVPSLQASIQKNPSLKIGGTPRSAPARMKENYTLNGSWLDTQWYNTFADYLVKYVEAYVNNGLTIWAITVQNEPKYETSSYTSMRMDPGNQISFLKNDIGPAFASTGLTAGIIAYDHNRDDPNYSIEILNDNNSKNFTIGSAFHGYAADVSAQSTVYNAHPYKGIWFTEITGGDYAPNFANNLASNMKNIIVGTTRNWAKGILLWNLVLDENNGSQNGGCIDCRGVVTVNSSTGQITKEVEYYVLGHISKFVDQGATRIFSTESNKIFNVAFENPDGSIAVIAYNNSNKPQETFTIRVGSESFDYIIPKNAAVTFKWTSNTSNNVPPTVSLTSPQNGTSFTSPTNITISADAIDTNGTIANVEFYANSNLLASDFTSPYSFDWLNVSDGNYEIIARTIDNEGAITDSDPVNITVTNGTGADTMFVSSITTGIQSASQGRKFGAAEVFVSDNLGNPVENAVVEGEFYGLFNEVVSGITAASGTVNFITSESKKGSVTINFCVSNISNSTLLFTSDPQWSCTNTNRELSLEKDLRTFKKDIRLV